MYAKGVFAWTQYETGRNFKAFSLSIFFLN